MNDEKDWITGLVNQRCGVYEKKFKLVMTCLRDRLNFEYDRSRCSEEGKRLSSNHTYLKELITDIGEKLISLEKELE